MVHEILEREFRKNYIAGRKEGKKEGRKEEKIEVAKRLKRENIDINIIVKTTNLSKKEIMQIS